MSSTIHMATPGDDGRHAPGPGALPLWNESYWFPLYDPAHEIGIVLRAGIQPNRGCANFFVFITHRGTIVHSLVEHAYPLPPPEPGRLTLGSFSLEWIKPLESFRLRYAHAPHGFDLVWEGVSPVYQYPHAPEVSIDQVPRHLEHAGRVTGTVTIAGQRFALDCLGHRDHTFGGERDWEKFYRWNYLSGEIGPDFWFNAVRIAFYPGMDWLHIGCLWDGRELCALQEIRMEVETTDGGTRQKSADLTMIDERGRAHHVLGEEVLVICPVRYGRTWLKDGIARYRAGNRIGHGILEHGYVED